MMYTGKQFVRWDDIDAFGHVNNAKYLTYIQEARFLWSPIIEMVVARAEVDYLEPIKEGGFEIDVAIWVSKIGNSSFTLEYELSSKAGIHAKARTVQVAVNMDTQRSRAITDEERTLLTEYLEA